MNHLSAFYTSFIAFTEEKISSQCSGSKTNLMHLSFIQVSNWFANARRRLKNTVRQPDLSWALRIKLYNKYVQGNAERLSVSSDDSCSEGLFLILSSCLYKKSVKLKIIIISQEVIIVLHAVFALICAPQLCPISSIFLDSEEE